MRRLALACLCPALSWAQPASVVYQGYLTDDAGLPIEGDVDLFFGIFDAPTGGMQLGTRSVPNATVAAGSFTVALDLDAADLSAAADVWLEVAVGDAFNVLSPRQRLGSVPFALRCADADTLGGLAGPAYQAAVTGSCAPGSAIRAINDDGTVACDPDAGQGGGLATIEPGAGLVGFLPQTGDIVIDLQGGPGLSLDPFGAVVPQYGGSGFSASVSRSDHTHAAYLPRGNALCFGTDKISAIDPSTGDVTCSPDAETTYGPGPSGNVSYVDATRQFDLSATPFFSGDVTAGFFDFPFPRVSALSRHAADFRPAGSDFAAYQGGSISGTLTNAGNTTLFAPLHLPDGATIIEIRVLFDKPVATDHFLCLLGVLHLDSGSYDSSSWGGIDCPPGIPCPFQEQSFFPGVVVDNSQNAYVAHCLMNSGGAFFQFFYGYRVFYETSGVTP